VIVPPLNSATTCLAAASLKLELFIPTMDALYRQIAELYDIYLC